MSSQCHKRHRRHRRPHNGGNDNGIKINHLVRDAIQCDILLQCILPFLDLASLARCSRTNFEMMLLCNKDALWKQLYRIHFRRIPSTKWPSSRIHLRVSGMWKWRFIKVVMEHNRTKQRPRRGQIYRHSPCTNVICDDTDARVACRECHAYYCQRCAGHKIERRRGHLVCAKCVYNDREALQIFLTE